MRLTLAAIAALYVLAVLTGCNESRNQTPVQTIKSPTAADAGDAFVSAKKRRHAGGAGTGAGGTDLPESVNDICPVTGLAIDPQVPPITVVLQNISPVQTVVIGTSSETAAKRVQADPEKYAAAAIRNVQARKSSDPIPSW